jgi:serine/threonine-protein kinase
MTDKPGLDETLPERDQHAGPANAPLPGYELGGVLGRGGMGEVVAARDARIGRDVAVKRLRAGGGSPDAVARFLREARIQARLDHPAIVPVHELGTDEHGQPYFTMKRLAGTTLKDRLGTGAMQPLLRAFVDVCFAIELAHTRGIVHRDLKPSNIMLGDYNDVYVLDWGIARELVRKQSAPMPVVGDSTPGETAAGTLLGTPGYMAPEQVRGDDVGTAADVYALGAILFEILAGELLHPSGNVALACTLAAPTASPAQRRPDRAIAPELDALCVEALAANPSARPSARALAERVQHYLDGDRDLARRRALAAEQLARAHAAVASQDPGRRAEAAQAAGRALALDPESGAAAQLVAQLILEPPRELPAELEAAIEDKERELDRDRSRRAVTAYLLVFGIAPFLPLFEIQSWPAIVALFSSCVAIAAIALVNARVRRVPPLAIMAGSTCVAIAFSRLASPFVLTPILVCGQLLATTSNAWLQKRAWFMVLWLVATLFAPLGLEWLGVLGSTWKMTPQGLLTTSTIMHMHAFVDVCGIMIGQLALALVVGGFTLQISAARRRAQRDAYVQAWHLRRMVLPRAVVGLP